MTRVTGNTGVPQPWLGPDDADPSVLEIDHLGTFEVRGSSLAITVAPEQGAANVVMTLDPYETEALFKLLHKELRGG